MLAKGKLFSYFTFFKKEAKGKHLINIVNLYLYFLARSYYFVSIFFEFLMGL